MAAIQTTTAGRAPRIPLRMRVQRNLFRWFYYAFVGAIFVFLIAPIAIVIHQSFNGVGYLSFPIQNPGLRWYRDFFGNDVWMRAIRTGLSLALIAAVISTLLGTMAAWALSRVTFRGKSLVLALMFSPIVAPTIILALAFYLFFADLQLIGNKYAIAAAYGVLGIPYSLVTVTAALTQFDPTQEHAAATLGAGPLRVLWHITLPQIATSIFAGFFFAFILAFDEVIIITFLGGGETITLARQMWNSVRYDLTPVLAVAGTLLIAFSMGIFLLVDIISTMRDRRRSG
ncbi:MAG: ABC transporter permease [Thermomicrobiales bacterium]|jgi:ABC-type spermidine/putrescine transport system permease subunit II